MQGHLSGLPKLTSSDSGPSGGWHSYLLSIRLLSKDTGSLLQLQAATCTQAYLYRLSFPFSVDCNLCPRHFKLPSSSQRESILNIHNHWDSFFWVSGTTIKYLNSSDSTRNNSVSPKSTVRGKINCRPWNVLLSFPRMDFSNPVHLGNSPSFSKIQLWCLWYQKQVSLPTAEEGQRNGNVRLGAEKGSLRGHARRQMACAQKNPKLPEGFQQNTFIYLFTYLLDLIYICFTCKFLEQCVFKWITSV